MVEPIYVPVLPTRRGALNAYEELDARVRRRIAPLWTVVPWTGQERTRGEPSTPAPAPDDYQTRLADWLTPLTDKLIKAMDGRPGWVDAAHVEGDIHGAAVSLWRLASRHSALRLVTGPERHPTLQRYTADLAFHSGRGLGIRVLVDTQDEPRPTDLLKLVDRLCLLPSRTDLILDIGAVTDAAEAGKAAITALDMLGSLIPWRTVVLTSGAFPRLDDNSRSAESRHISERHDWQLHQAVCAARPEFPRRVLYGDYSTEHAFNANRPHVREKGPPWGVMRYTTEDVFFLGRTPTRDGARYSRADRIDRVRATARWIAESEGFRGAECSEGERWLDACAQGEGSKGSGSAGTWIKVGHIQHMNFVVLRLIDDVA